MMMNSENANSSQENEAACGATPIEKLLVSKNALNLNFQYYFCIQ